MIGKIMMGKSFRGCIQYCLNDKLAREENQEKIMKDRAEILCYNQCFGNQVELIRQFNEVRMLNSKLARPVMHITLSFAEGERLANYQLADIVQECAKDLGFAQNQYLAVLHKDTRHQHIHVIANRIGFDGKTVKDGQNFKRIAAHCRKMEHKYELKPVLNPKRFLSKEQRQILRLDNRKQLLVKHIVECLFRSRDYKEFEKRMKQLHYDVIKGRGIAFRDRQKVYTKGSEVGYSLVRIERILGQKKSLDQGYQNNQESIGFKISRSRAPLISALNLTKCSLETVKTARNLLQPESPSEQSIVPEYLRLKKQKRKRKTLHH